MSFANVNVIGVKRAEKGEIHNGAQLHFACYPFSHHFPLPYCNVVGRNRLGSFLRFIPYRHSIHIKTVNLQIRQKYTKHNDK